MNADQFATLSFGIAIFGLTYFEKQRVKSVITPFTVSAWPFVFISLLVNFALVDIGYPHVSQRALYFILANLLIGWIAGLVFQRKAIHRSQLSDMTSKLRADLDILYAWRLPIMLISWILSIYVLREIYTTAMAGGGLWFVGSREFEKEMATGLLAHLLQVGRALFLLLFFATWKKKKSIFVWGTLILLGVVSSANQVKYPIMWLALIVLFTYNNHKTPKQQIRNISFAGILIVLLFLSLMSITFLTWDFNLPNVTDYLFHQFMSYLASGPIMLDVWLDYPGIKPEWTLLLVMENLSHVISGNPYRIIGIDMLNLGFLPIYGSYTSNVGTSFGVYYLVGGVSFSFAISAFFYGLAYFLYYKARIYEYFIIFFFSNYILAILSLSFFVQFFTLVTFWELPVIFIGFYIIIRILYHIKILVALARAFE
jgi:hypothetical protein